MTVQVTCTVEVIGAADAREAMDSVRAQIEESFDCKVVSMTGQSLAVASEIKATLGMEQF